VLEKTVAGLGLVESVTTALEHNGLLYMGGLIQ
jgi:hypothetical protein